MAMSNANMAMSNAKADGHAMMMSAAKSAGNLPVEGEIPSFAGAMLVAELAAAHARELARQGGGRGFLDLFVHQLPARAALRGIVVRRNTRITAWS